MQANDYIQYGCGLSAPETWTNFDVSPSLRAQRIPVLGRMLTRGGPDFPRNVRYGDIVKGLPVAPGSCKGIYCSHVLEHLSLADMRAAVQNTHRCLAPGGIFRFVLPDLEYLAREYLASEAEQPAVEFMESSMLGSASRPRTPKDLLRSWIGNSRHLWMWDYRSIEPELRRAGFTGIRRASFGDSSDPRFKDVEDLSRWENCLGVECRKGSI